jgi:uncharacterized membrane protein HdeD (DUF308 family)
MEEVYIGVKNWWSYLITGIIAVVFGIVLLAWPASTIKVLAYVVGILALVTGAVETIWALALLFKKEKRGLLLVRGLVGVLVGLLLLTKTGFALTLVVVVIAIWAIVSGIVEFIASLEMPPKSGRGWLAVSGVLTIILGILLVALPLETVYAIIVILSVFLFADAIVRFILAFYARKFEKELQA